MNDLTPAVANVDKAWIQTASGGKFHILDPRLDEIHITDIAHALSMMCRFTGHVRKFYSVAEHSYHASTIVPKEDALWALLHDSPEAYIADMNRPLKHFTNVGHTYIAIEETIMSSICKKFHLPEEAPESVKIADRLMLYTEKAQLMPPMDWEHKWSEDEKAADCQVFGWLPKQAETMFLYRYYELTKHL